MPEGCTSLRLGYFKSQGGGGFRVVTQPAFGIEQQEQKIKHGRFLLLHIITQEKQKKLFDWKLHVVWCTFKADGDER